MTLEEVTTLKEATKRLKEVIKEVRSTIQPFLYDNEAKDYILKALEQEPCEDCISRQAVIDIIEKEEFKGDALSEIEKLTSVNPQEPKFVVKSDGTIEQIKNCNDCLLRKEWEKIGKMLSATLEKQTEQEDILNKIRAEIMRKDGLEEALEIIDKYKAESEDEK